jgi:hypothetical protein
MEQLVGGPGLAFETWVSLQMLLATLGLNPFSRGETQVPKARPGPPTQLLYPPVSGSLASAEQIDI